MSARRSPIERDARRIASDALQGTRRRRKRDQSAWEVIEEAVQVCERLTSYAVVSDDIPRARRTARAGQLLDEAQIRLVARQKRDTARKLERAGIVPNARVVVVRTGYGTNAAPTGTVMTLEDATDTYYIWGTDDDGHRWLVNSGDIEVVPDAPIPDSRIEDEPVAPHDDEWGDAAAAAQSEYGLDLANAVRAARREVKA
jgi:hypothetical protein